jgi:hypothetical protein
VRSLTVVAIMAVSFICATWASADVVGGNAATVAGDACPVAHCPEGSVLRGDTCIANRCIGVMCPKFVKVCPAGTHLGRRSINDCCNNACVKDCKRPLQPPG